MESTMTMLSAMQFFWCGNCAHIIARAELANPVTILTDLIFPFLQIGVIPQPLFCANQSGRAKSE
jgi:hypothetical protein